ncbi:MAG: DNA polymerase I [Flavobacteriales bacterium]
MSSEKKLFLIDAFAIIFRSYFAFGSNQRYNSKGLNTSVMLGFTNTLLEILNKEKPSHIAICFDPQGKTFREDMFPAYKAHRDETPEDIKKAIPYIYKLADAFNIKTVVVPSYEADDVIGTLAKRAEREGFTTYMMTPDKDFAQLVTDNILLYRPAKSGNAAEVWGIKEVCAKFEVQRVEQVIDILGLWGDSADNIPGIPGIGEKTSKLLIAKYDSVEGLIANAQELKGKQKENVIAFAEQGLLSKKLATIEVNVPIDFSVDDLKFQEPDKEKISELFNELEFRTLAQRILGSAVSASEKAEVKSKPVEASSQMDMFEVAEEEPIIEEEQIHYKTIADVEHNYILIDSDEEAEQLITVLFQQKEFCFDSETTGIDSHIADVVGLSFSFEAHKAWYVNIPDGDVGKYRLSLFKSLFENKGISKIGQNIKYDMNVLLQYGISVKGKLFDTMLAHYLIEPDMRHNMDYLAETYLGYKPVSIETLIGKKGKNQSSMRDVELEKIKEYAAEDADVTYQLKVILEKILQDKGDIKLFEEIEMPLVQVLSKMEMEGIKIDTNALVEFSKELLEQLIQLEKEIYVEAGVEFNINSPKQMGDVLFETMNLDEKAKKTKTGQYATSEEVLQKLLYKHPIIQKILDYRGLQKLKSTYVDALPEMVNKETGKIHTTFSQAVAATGRLSSVNPNLQNIPIKTAKGREVRKAFIPNEESHVLLSADYSQVELRLIAELSGDAGMIEAFQSKQDIHSATASKVFGVPLEEVSKEMRGKAKMVNFGIIYGISAFGLAQRLNISRTEAKEIIDNYFNKYPRIREYMDESIENAKQTTFVKTLMGRKRYLKDINSANAVVRGYAERNAINAPIQGSAADIIKKAMIEIQRELDASNLKAKMVLQVHDELVFTVPMDEVEVLKPIVKRGMEKAVQTQVPLEVEISTGKNWLEAH